MNKAQSNFAKIISYNFLGTFFDKFLILLITLALTKFILPEDYARWGYFFQFVLLTDAVLMNSTLGIFSRTFFLKKTDHIEIYQWKIFFGLILISLLTFFYLFSIDLKFIIIELGVFLSFIFYNYVCLFLRFSNQNKSFFAVSFFKLLIFSIIITVTIILNDMLEYNKILLSFFISHFVVILPFINKIKVLNKKNDPSTSKEFFSLSTYGLSSGLINSLDKILITFLGLSPSFFASYYFLVQIASIPNLFTEIIKKSLVPFMYSDYSSNSRLTNSTKKKVLKSLSVLLIIQISLPIITYLIFQKMNFINEDYIAYPNIIISIIIISISFNFWNIYHFVNPVIIFFKKTWIMTTSLLLSSSMFVFFIMFYRSESLVVWAFGKAILFSLSLILTLFIKKLSFSNEKN